ncbi:type IV toxin-antitoxin system AbiEi family antitoxin domain-containing protein [Vreelandella janggokensis]|uniref:type IV toxin-antitoxin system AbiEi family antitoxin domain-containing protein n=1 Tax=Vreelandella janggokensis TaxID=370767 RepID=UPI00285C2543|nr:type IV toxin-antitoxin system AbiEi family antitoxin domain-containing protein [Halomonas janggokensis]MDR5886525.1 type IV toxin-antitoxin system AbiEi family antitoxin domain-containing protein [Halomonas janggokensis]
MSEQKSSKLNQLLASLGDSDLVSSRWLQAHGYSRSLVARYVSSGWLVSPARGVYLRKGGRLQWQGVLRSLQEREGLALYAGGRFALAMQGYEHYLRLGEAATITLYGDARPPGWLRQLALPERFEFCGKPPFDWPLSDFTEDTQKGQLSEQGLKRQEVLSGAGTIVCSTPERAILELCDGPAGAALVYEADTLMQSLATLSPRRVTGLLRHCSSIKAARLFLALADRYQHAWLKRISLEGVDLGSGKRVLVPGGRLHPTYQITLPRDLDEHLG